MLLPEPALAQQAQAERGVPYLTLRDRLHDDDDDDEYYGSDRGPLQAGRCLIDQVSLDFLSSVIDSAPFRIPDEILSVDGIEETSRDTLLDQLQANASGNLLLYIHGYYIDFDKGCRRATVFKENAGLDDRFLWFSWSADGSILNYARDEVNLYWSVPDFAEVIVDLHDRFGAGNVDLAAHSLGARGLALALYEIASTHPDYRFGEVIFVAPDMDFEIFGKLLPRFQPLAQSITIYTSASDKALAVSEQLHGYPRLGTSGNDVARLEAVEVIDTSDLRAQSASGHLYHLYDDQVGRDINRLVNEGKPAALRDDLEQVDVNLWKLLPTE